MKFLSLSSFKVNACCLLMLYSVSAAYAANDKSAGQSLLINSALFWLLLFVIIMLLFFIISVGKVVKNLADTDWNKEQSKTGGSNSLLVLLSVGLASLWQTNQLYATETPVPSSTGAVFFIDFTPIPAGVLWIMVSAIIFELFILFGLFVALRKMLKAMGMESEQEEEVKPVFNFAKWSATLNDAVPIEREAEIMTNHEYDGIRELDNNLPPWWKYGFYLTIIISIVYIFNYHVSRTGMLQSAEYMQELQVAEVAKQEYLKNLADNVDENSVTVMLSTADIAAGKNIFKEKCTACHGQAGEGGVGPNLTDDYWLHGGGIKNVFKTIKYGVPAKGMIAWQAQIKPVEIQQLSSFILSLHGTNPPGAKAPQGDFYSEKLTANADSSHTDSIVIMHTTKDSLINQVTRLNAN